MQNSKQIFNVRVIPRARVNSIVIDDDGTIRIHTTTAPADGKANHDVIRMLAKHFNVSKSSIKIIRGQTNHTKIIEII